MKNKNRKAIWIHLCLALSLFVGAFAFFHAPAYANAPVSSDEARYSVFRVIIKENGVVAYFGSSFYIGTGAGGEQYLLTNYHVVSPNENGVYIYFGETREIKCEVVGKLVDKDLAVLKLTEEITDTKPLPLGADENVKAADEVFVLGFPTKDISDTISRLPDDVTINKGVVSKRSTWQGTRIYQTDASLNEGNSGGPLLHKDGYVIGVCSMKMEQADRVGAAVIIDEAFSMLDDLKVNYSLLSGTANTPGTADPGIQTPEPVTTVNPDESPVPDDVTPRKNTSAIWIGIFVVAALLFAGLLAYLFILRKKNGDTGTLFVPRKRVFGQVIGLKGPYAGSVISLSSDTIFFGRDAMKCQLVFDERQKLISRVHCSVRYDDKKGVFLLENYSRNGTFLEDGRPIEDGKPVFLRNGDRFYLADESNMFELSDQRDAPQSIWTRAES